MIKIIECPRDAMQGLSEFIPTQTKANYINALLKVGFDTIDFGSFVSPRAIPQLRDTAEVLSLLDMAGTKSKLLAIVANRRGAETAAGFEQITYLGYPHSISPTFLKKNINSDIRKSLDLVEAMLEICAKSNKELVVYISMGFGNPYDDEWSADIVEESVAALNELGVRIIPLSDTTGISTYDNIEILFKRLIPAYPSIEFGFHLHTTIKHWQDQINIAYINGCRRFDTVMLGLGGCPMAEDNLVGNMKTVNLVEYLEGKGIDAGLDKEAFEEAYVQSLITFNKFLA